MSYLAHRNCIVGSSLNHFKGLNSAADWHQKIMADKNKNKARSTWPAAVA